MHFKVTLKNFKSGVVVRKYILFYNDTEKSIILKCLDGKTKTYQKNEWALIKTTIVY